MGKVLLPALLAVLISACAASAIELRSSNGPTDSPFGMSEVAMPEGVTKDKWKKIKADILAELPKLTKCQSNLDECTSTVRKFEEIVKEAERLEGLAKIAFINAVINALIDYEPDRSQWGVADRGRRPSSTKKVLLKPVTATARITPSPNTLPSGKPGCVLKTCAWRSSMTMPSASIMPFSSCA